MDSGRFDAWTRSLVAARTRRAALRLVAGGLVAVAARPSGPVAAAICPDRVPKPGFKPQTNGCGDSSFLGGLVPNGWNRATFKPACDAHDRCYGTCNANRAGCDRDFLKDLYQACDRAYRGTQEQGFRDRCRSRAHTYYEAVFRRGQTPYEVAQGEACDCCAVDQVRCGDRCCDRCATCRDGRCLNDSSSCGAGGKHTCCSPGFVCCPDQPFCCNPGKTCNPTGGCR